MIDCFHEGVYFADLLIEEFDPEKMEICLPCLVRYLQRCAVEELIRRDKCSRRSRSWIRHDARFISYIGVLSHFFPNAKPPEIKGGK